MINLAGARVCSWLLFGLLAGNLVNAQGLTDRADWKESDVPPPPAYDMNKLLSFEVTRSSPLVYGVDPASVSISNSDSIVRYVIVATTPAGAKNVMYEGLRCATGEVRTYARAAPSGTWVPVADSEWKSVYNPALPKHSLRFAQAGACQQAAPVGSVRELVRKLKNPSVD